jgi:cobalamin biosynthesis protein CbiG
MFPRYVANVAALDRLLGPLTAPGTAADTERAAERRHQELVEEVRRGRRDLADLPLEHLRCLLARALRRLGVAVLRMAPVPSAHARTVDDDEEEEEDDDEEDEE